MKGLLIKDFKLIFCNVRMIILLVCISIFMVSMQKEEMFSFVISYMTIVAFMFVLSSISYDDFDHGMSFLMTLPITRRIYVTEKYCFGLLCGAGGWLFAFILCLIFSAAPDKGMITKDYIISCVLIYTLLLFLLSIMIPIQLKFGADNGKIALLIIIGICFVIGMLADKIAKDRSIDLSGWLDRLAASADHLVPGIIISAICALFISFLISLRIMKNKPL